MKFSKQILAFVACLFVWQGLTAQAYTKFTRNYGNRPGVPNNLESLDIYVPNSSNPGDQLPVMVYVHGGTWKSGDKSNTHKKDEWFTDNGLIFVSINYRLSPNPIDLSDPNRIMFPKHPRDVARALDWVADNISTYRGDPDKIMMLGHSAGAHLVALVSTDETYLNNFGHDLSLIKCTCALDGVAHDINAWLATSPGNTNDYYNAFGTDPADWTTASPITHATPGKNIPPIYLVVQNVTRRININEDFRDDLILAGYYSQSFTTPTLDHSQINRYLGDNTKGPEAVDMSNRVKDFYQDCLTGQLGSQKQGNQQNHFDRKGEALHVWPNPVEDQLTIDLPTGTMVRLYDLTGRLLRHQALSETGRLDLAELAKGTYVLSAAGQHVRIVKR